MKSFDGSAATPSELRCAGIDALGTIHFLQQFDLVGGDDPAERDSILGDPTVDELVDVLPQRDDPNVIYADNPGVRPCCSQGLSVELGDRRNLPAKALWRRPLACKCHSRAPYDLLSVAECT
jgi:hypothetical protein